MSTINRTSIAVDAEPPVVLVWHTQLLGEDGALVQPEYTDAHRKKRRWK